MQLLAALGCVLDLRYLGSGVALGNLVQGLAILHRRALAEWLLHKIMFGRMAPVQHHVIIDDRTSSVRCPNGRLRRATPSPPKEEAMAQLPYNCRQQGHHTAITGAGSLKASNTSVFFTR